MNNEIRLSEINGVLTANPSKSYEQRLIAACMLSGGDCVINGVGNSTDVKAAREIIKAFGCGYTLTGDKRLFITHNDKNISSVLDCKESAFNVRMFTPIACVKKDTFTMTGCGSLLKRWILGDYGILQLMGCSYRSNEGYLPVTFSETHLLSGTYTIEGGRSSQFISGLIMSFPLLDGDTTLVVYNPVSIDYILMTLSTIKSFGINISYIYNRESKLSIIIPGNQSYKAGEYYVEGDWSGASVLLTAAALSGKVGIKGLTKETMQPDCNILTVFDMAGVAYHWENSVLYAEKSPVQAFTFDATDCPDLIPVLCVLALAANGTTTIIGATRLQYKESRRGEVLQSELSKVGADIHLDNDIITINGGKTLHSAILDSHNDHRIAMALAIVGTIITNGVIVTDSQCVAKSYPNFFDDLNTLNVSTSQISKL